MFKNLNTDEITKELKEKAESKKAEMTEKTNDILERFENRHKAKQQMRKNKICGSCIHYNNFTNYCPNVSYGVFFHTTGCSVHTFCDA